MLHLLSLSSKARVMSIYDFHVADLQVRSELDFQKSSGYGNTEADSLPELAHGRNDGIFTTGLEFEEPQVLNEPVKLQGSPTLKTKGQLTLLDQVIMKNWQFVVGQEVS